MELDLLVNSHRWNDIGNTLVHILIKSTLPHPALSLLHGMTVAFLHQAKNTQTYTKNSHTGKNHIVVVPMAFILMLLTSESLHSAFFVMTFSSKFILFLISLPHLVSLFRRKVLKGFLIFCLLFFRHLLIYSRPLSGFWFSSISVERISSWFILSLSNFLLFFSNFLLFFLSFGLLLGADLLIRFRNWFGFFLFLNSLLILSLLRFFSFGFFRNSRNYVSLASLGLDSVPIYPILSHYQAANHQ